MQEIMSLKRSRKAALDRHPFFEWVRSDAVPLERRLLFAPIMTIFVMNFRDANKWFIRFPRPRSEYEGIINGNTLEDETHSRLFLEDWKKLRLDEALGWRAGDTLWWLFLARETEPFRRYVMEFARMTVEDGNDPLVRFAHSEAGEACGNCFFANLVPVATQLEQRTGIKYRYFGAHHLEREPGHVLESPGIFESLTLTPEQRAKGLELATRMFDVFDEMHEQFLHYGLTHVMRGTFPRRPRGSPRPAEASAPTRPEPPWTTALEPFHHDVLELLLERKERTAKHRFYAWLRDAPGLSAREKLQRFVPMWVGDILGYRDLNHHAIRYREPRTVPERVINRWCDELETHNALFMADWDGLGLDEALGWDASDTLRFCFLDPQMDVHRRNMCAFLKLAMRHTSPVLRFWLLEALEASGHAFFEHTKRLALLAEAETGARLDYLADRHDAGQVVRESASLRRSLLTAEPLPIEARDVALAMVETVFDAIDEQLSVSLEVARSNKLGIGAPAGASPPASAVPRAAAKVATAEGSATAGGGASAAEVSTPARGATEISAAPAGRRAVVVGGGMGGMMAARVLSEHFDEVVIVERDRLDGDAATRKGVPQAAHLHGLLKRGELILDELFPGLVEALCDKGAERVVLGSEMAWYHFDRWKATCRKGILATFLTRPFLEGEVRERVRAIPNVRWLDGHAATGYAAGAGGARVAGVSYQSAAGGPEATLGADLVVDSAGRGTRAPAWLSALGYAAPEESEVKVHIGYSTCVFRRPPVWKMPWKALVVVPANSTRMAAVMPVEGGRLVASAAGLLRDYPPGDLPGFLAFMRGLPVDGIYQAIKDLEPLGEVATTRFPGNHWIHYEKMPRFPDGLVVLGDAVGCYNPVYGQGMTLAAIHVELLRDALGRARHADLSGFSRPFQKQVAAAVHEAWQMSSSEDFRFRAVEGKRPPGYEQMKWYMDHVHAATSVDPVVYERFLEVMHLLAPFPSLLSPPFALRVMRAAREAHRRDPSRGPLPRWQAEEQRVRA